MVSATFSVWRRGTFPLLLRTLCAINVIRDSKQTLRPPFVSSAVLILTPTSRLEHCVSPVQVGRSQMPIVRRACNAPLANIATRRPDLFVSFVLLVPNL
jgi:hypothetical protein